MKLLFLGVSFAVVSLSAGAQSISDIAQLAKRLEGTLYVVPHRESADGVLESCGLEFSALKSDDHTRKGAPVRVVGSFYLRTLPTAAGLAYMLKLGVFDGLGKTVAVAPANAFVRGTNSNAPKKGIRQKSETEGYAIFVGVVDDEVTAAFADIAEKKQLLVGFNRKPGQRDVSFAIDLTVVEAAVDDNGQVSRRRSDEAVNQFVACSGDLIKAAKMRAH